jgi:RNA recognition motif-containing protein
MTSRWADEDIEEDDTLIMAPPVVRGTDISNMMNPESGKISYSAFSRPTTSRPKTQSGMSVVVRGMEESITEGQISRFFQSCSPDISFIRIIKSKGMAIVEIKNKSGLDKALAMDGFKLGKKIVQVSIDTPFAPKRKPVSFQDAKYARESTVEGEDYIIQDDEERPKLVLLPRSGPAPGLDAPSFVDAFLPPGIAAAAPVVVNQSEKNAARMLRKKAAIAPKPKAAPKRNRFAGLGGDSSEESGDSEDSE